MRHTKFKDSRITDKPLITDKSSQIFIQHLLWILMDFLGFIDQSFINLDSIKAFFKICISKELSIKFL